MKGITFVITVGKYAGFYVNFGHVKRICLGWIAFDVHPYDLDFILGDYARLKKGDHHETTMDD